MAKSLPTGTSFENRVPMRNMTKIAEAIVSYSLALFFLWAAFIAPAPAFPSFTFVTLAAAMTLLITTLICRYRFGIVRILSLRYKLNISLLLSMFLLISPYLFGFYTQTQLPMIVPSLLLMASSILAYRFHFIRRRVYSFPPTDQF
jgi:hypothetical protein